MFQSILQVALGGAVGAVLRYLTNVGAKHAFGPGYPFGTLIVNIVGSFLMGFLVVYLARKGGNQFAPFLMTGILGGFTTFSAFSLDTLTIWERGEPVSAFVYVAVSVLGALAAIAAGLAVARSFA
jgi:CrcB protein